VAAVTSLILAPLASQGSSALVGEKAETGSALSGVNRVSVSDMAADAIPVRARSCPLGSVPAGVGCIDRHPVYLESTPEHCPSAREAVSHYRDMTHDRQRLRGAALADRTPIVAGKSCRWARHAADTWKARAHAARIALERWQYEYAWWLWLPAFDRAVAECETPTPDGTMNFRHHAGTYEGAWGWWHGTWLGDRPKGAPEHAYDATPRQQWEAFKRGWYVLHHYWGCIANGGYRSHMS
jgi:hypothetical protein